MSAAGLAVLTRKSCNLLQPSACSQSSWSMVSTASVNLPTYPLEPAELLGGNPLAQACQILFTLQCLDRRKPSQSPRLRVR
jgi:hypothetical protein